MSDRMARMTCSVHQDLHEELLRIVQESEPFTVFFEPCRFVRQVRYRRSFGLPGIRTVSEDVPGERYYITGSLDQIEKLADRLVHELDLASPGRGSLTVQHVQVNKEEDSVPFLLPAGASDDRQVLKGPGKAEQAVRQSAGGSPYSQITCIISNPSAGEGIAKLALALGAGLPYITLGIGTGIRDRLGLLRITIPPEKELVHLVVPQHDADGIIQQLIESGRLDRPGGGFIYQVPVHRVQLDSRTRIGIQEYSASIEQIIASMDELRGGTMWRKRFVSSKESKYSYMKKMQEIVTYSQEGYSGELVAAAMRAGAGGATISRVQRVCLAREGSDDDHSADTAAWERVIILTAARKSGAVARALQVGYCTDPVHCGFAEILPVPLAYSYGS